MTSQDTLSDRDPSEPFKLSYSNVSYAPVKTMPPHNVTEPQTFINAINSSPLCFSVEWVDYAQSMKVKSPEVRPVMFSSVDVRI